MPSDRYSSGPNSLIDWAGDERVTLAIVFTDVVGSTALGARLGDERMNDVREAHFRRGEELIAQHGGRQVKTIGDSVMAVFRSVGSAFDFSRALHLDPGHAELRESGIRAGLHSGEVHVIEDDVFGTEVNFAARVAHAIAGAEIWVSARALEAIERAGAHRQQGLSWQQHDKIELKGLGQFSLWSLDLDASPPPPEPTGQTAAAASPPEPRPEPPQLPPEPPEARPEPPRKADARGAASNGRTIFVARPAGDMGEAYIRVVEELKGRGYTVVPDSDIPNDDSAVAFIDKALAGAELSIHLLGERPGFTPDTAEAMPTGQMQLVRAARRSEQETETGKPQFRRIVWAPRSFEAAAGPQAEAPEERNPVAVLEQFDEQLPGDKVLGENLTQFVNYLNQHLDKTRPRRRAPQRELGPGERIFIDHTEEDYDYATELAEALQQLSFEPVFAAILDDDSDRRRVDMLNRKELLACSAVAYCWGNASDVWLRSRHSKVNGWRNKAKLDELELTLIAAPPSHRAKERYIRVKLPGIDRVVNMTGVDKPSAEDVAEWLGPGSGDTSDPARDS